MWARFIVVAVFTLVVMVNPGRAQQPPPVQSAQEQAAVGLLQAADWTKALPAFRALVAAEAANARAWFGLHVVLHGVGEFDEALSTLTRARDLGYPNVAQMHFRFARTYARMGNTDKALESLTAFAQAGGTTTPLLQNPDLESVRSLPRFTAIIDAINRSMTPCEFDPNARALDFWIGEWDVQQTGQPRAPQGSTSRIEKSLDGCLIIEHWLPGAPPTGKSFNTYNREIKQWEQFWVDSRGQVTHYRGGFQPDGSLLYESTENGGATKLRMTFFNQGPNQVRQFGQHSSDGGRTWQTRYDLTYIRKTVSL